jgi:hypothetical protein
MELKYYLIAGIAAGVDRLAWAVFGHIWRLVPPKPWEPWWQAVFSGIGGVVGAFVITQVIDRPDLFSIIVGAYIGSRLVGGILDTMAKPRQVDAARQ